MSPPLAVAFGVLGLAAAVTAALKWYMDYQDELDARDR